MEALQELRFAAKESGIEQQTLDMPLQRFPRLAAEAAQGTGAATDALAQMGLETSSALTCPPASTARRIAYVCVRRAIA